MEMNPLLKRFVNSWPWAALLERWFLPPLFERIAGLAPARVLEIGCGRGDTTRMLLARFPASAIMATDYDGAQVALAGRRVRDGRAEFRQADATALPFPDASFDLAVECNTFHHVAKWVGAMRETARVLKPGGTFAVMDEDAKLFGSLARWFDRPESTFAKSEFVFAADQEGFDLVADASTARIIRCVFRKRPPR